MDSGRGPARDGRRGFLELVGSAGLTGLAGCVGSPIAATPESITLEYVDVGGARSEELFSPVIEELNERYDATIELQFTEIPYENMRQQLLTQVGGGNAPDIAAIDQIWLGSFIDSGQLIDLTPAVEEIEFEDYLDAFTTPVSHDGSVFGIPITTDVRGMYWNKEQFEAAGLDPDRPPQTWTELVEMGKQLHDPPETVAAAYFVVGGRWTVNLFAAGGDILDESQTEPRFHEAPGIDAATFVDRLHNESELTAADPLYENGARVSREFLQGTYAINVIEGSWLDFFWRNLGHDNESMVDQFGFAPTPTPEGAEPVTMSGGFVWAGFSTTDHPEVVQDFLQIAGARPFKQQVAIETQSLPTRESLLDEPDIWDEMLYADEVRSLLEHTRTRPVRNWSVVGEQLDRALQEVAYDRSEPASALQTAADAVRSELGGES